MLLDELPSEFAPLRVDVADGEHLGVGLGQETAEVVVGAVVAHADQAEGDPIARGGHFREAQGSTRNHDGSGKHGARGTAQQIAAAPASRGWARAGRVGIA